MKKLIIFIAYFSIVFTLSAQGSRDLVGNIINEVNQDTLLKYVEELSGEVSVIVGGTQQTIVSRHKNAAGNIIAANYLKEKLTSYGYNTYFQDFSSTGRNVYAVKTGTEFPDQQYMICAHYDAMPSSGPAPGADDNGSGTAAVIEAARILKDMGLPYTVIFALWDEEEQGLVGSNYYADNAASAGDNIRGVVNLDMIAWEENGDNTVRIHTKDIAQSYKLSDKMVEAISKYDLNLTYSIKDPGITASDHASFWSNGYSAILLIEDDVNDFNNYYHTSNDLIQYFDNEYFVNCSKLAIATLSTFALNLDIQIIHEPMTSIEHSNDIIVEADIVSGLEIASGADAPSLYYRADHGAGFNDYTSVTGQNTTGNTYEFTIPGQMLGTLVEYYIAAQDVNGDFVTTLPEGGSGTNPPGSIPPPSAFQFFVAPYDIVFEDNCGSMGHWAHTGSWNITDQYCVSQPYSLTDSPDDNYPGSYDAYMTMNESVSLADAIGVELSFKLKYDIEDNWDYAQIEISTNNGTTWTPLEGLFTNPGTGSFQPNGEPLYDGVSDWVTEKISLNSYIGDDIKIRFQMKSDGYIEEDGIYIDDFMIINYTIVPVELVSFKAEATEAGVMLNWKTLSELNNKGFKVLRSENFEDYVALDFVDGNGTTTQSSSYTYFDQLSGSGEYQYKLIQTDFDGAEKIYGPVEVNFEGVNNYALNQNYPNPFNPGTMINYSIPVSGKVNITVYDILGNKVATLVNSLLEQGSYEVSFNAGNLSSGMYIYTINVQGADGSHFMDTQKMMLMK
ncbi:MAG: hypothetical protein SCALA702_27920 [Melioribacteraceae bacterium]|nr:MAG: hypothetical protein SCALA702_27920 [Melioribacteraceae bacterium]